MRYGRQPVTTADATVKCKGNTHPEIEFVDEAGETKRLDADGYFQSGYRATIRVPVKDGLIHESD
jgi:hypothetical protein